MVISIVFRRALLLLACHIWIFSTATHAIPPSPYSMNENGITWHHTCSERNPANHAETKKAAISRAWSGALELSNSAWRRFTTQTYPKVSNGPLNAHQQDNINQVDPAYVQLFGLDWNHDDVEHIKSTLEHLDTRGRANQGQSERPAGAHGQLSITCKDSYQDEGDDICERGSYGSTASHELVKDPSTMIFCPAFFHLPRFDLLKGAAAGSRSTREYQSILSGMFKEPDAGMCDKEYHGSDAGMILHEMSHIWWLGATNAPALDPNNRGHWILPVPEEYGYLNCAELAWDSQHDSQLFVKNADTYVVCGIWLLANEISRHLARCRQAGKASKIIADGG